MFRVLTLSALLTCPLLAFGQTPAASTTGQDPQAQTAPQARGGKRNRVKSVKKMDTDGDQKVSREEWKGKAEAFELLDGDKDGFVTRKEFNQTFKDRGARALKNLDANSDGKIARDEWTRDAEMFTRLDANSDGFLTPEEMRRQKGRHQKRS